jgi:hypothetical protein
MAYPIGVGDLVGISFLDPLGLSNGYDLTAPGWITSPNTFVYVSATSFKVVGADVRARYSVGTKLSYTDVTTKYAYAGLATYAGGNTTVPIITDTADQLSGGAITNPMYSYMATPYGMPGGFNYTPAYVGWQATPTLQCSLSCQGKLLTVSYSINGTGNATNRTISLGGFTAAAVYDSGAPLGYATDNGASAFANGTYAAIQAVAPTLLTFYKTASATGWTNSGACMLYGKTILTLA